MNQVLDLESGEAGGAAGLRAPTRSQIRSMRLLLAVVGSVCLVAGSWLMVATGAVYTALPWIPRWTCAAPLPAEHDAVQQLFGADVPISDLGVRSEGGRRFAAVRSQELVAVVTLEGSGSTVTAVPADNTAEYLAGSIGSEALPAVGTELGAAARACVGG